MAHTSNGAVDVATRLIEAFSAADFEAMRSLMAEEVVAEITDAAGGSARVPGREALLERIEAMDLPAARYSVTLTQAPVPVDEDGALVMVEIRAERGGRRLHNFAAHLFRVADGRVERWLMVDAKPAESDEFWA
jgi:ketosteroid isomerase-like protein